MPCDSVITLAGEITIRRELAADTVAMLRNGAVGDTAYRQADALGLPSYVGASRSSPGTHLYFEVQSGGMSVPVYAHVDPAGKVTVASYSENAASAARTELARAYSKTVAVRAAKRYGWRVVENKQNPWQFRLAK